jgi:CRP-like cAMP-binding protein
MALLRLANGDAPRRADGDPVVVPRRLLGELVGATRESTSLVLGRLTAEGLIQRVGNGLVINDLGQLAARLQTTQAAPIELYDERETRPVAL